MIVSELISLLGFRTDMSGAREFDATISKLQSSATSAAAQMQNVFQAAAIGITAAFGSLALVGRPIAQAGDDMTMAIAKLKSSLGDSAIAGGEAVAVYEKLFEISQKTGVAANDSAQGFTQLQLAMKDMGRPASDTIDLLEGIQSAGIIAGQKTADVTEVIRQLGQAFGKGKLNGDELVTLSERMPRLVREIQKEMKMTTAEFFDASSKGKLTPEMLAPALLAAGKRSTEELAKFPLTMSRAYGILTSSANRFLAELDKQLGLSQSVAKIFKYIAETLNIWRSGLSVIGDFVTALGGLEGIVRLVGIALLVAFGSQIFGAVTGLLTVFGALGRTILVSMLPLAGFLAWVLIIEDFIVWMQGGGSKFGDRLGEFSDFIAPAKAKLEEFKTWFNANFNFSDVISNTRAEFERLRDFFSNLWETIKSTWNSNVDGMRPQIEWLRSAAGLLMDAFRPLTDFFTGVFDVILKNINAFYDRVMVVINGVTGAIRGMLGLIPGLMAATEGTGTGTDPEKQAAGRKNWSNRAALPNFLNPELASELSGMLGGLSPIPDVSGRVGGSTNNVNAPQNNNITNNVEITAPGGDAASVAAGVNAGMGRATDGMVARLGNSMALGLGLSSPRVEAPAMP